MMRAHHVPAMLGLVPVHVKNGGSFPDLLGKIIWKVIGKVLEFLKIPLGLPRLRGRWQAVRRLDIVSEVLHGFFIDHPRGSTSPDFGVRLPVFDTK